MKIAASNKFTMSRSRLDLNCPCDMIMERRNLLPFTKDGLTSTSGVPNLRDEEREGVGLRNLPFSS